MPGETGSVLADLAARLNADADADEAWALIFQAALDLRQAALAMQIMTARHQRRGDGASYAYRRMIALLQAAPSSRPPATI